MRRWNSRSRVVGAVIVATLAIATGASAAWSDGEPSDGSTPTSSPTASATAEPTATASPTPSATPSPTPSPTPSRTPSPTPAPAASTKSPARVAPAQGKAHSIFGPSTLKQASVSSKTKATAEAKRKAAKKAAAKKAAARKAAATKPVKAPAHVPAGGLVCHGSGGAGAGEQKIDAIGKAINAFRKSHGRKTLTISRSAGLVVHAKRMATTGGIWHSGHENIVACVSNDSAKTMVKAWAASPPHRQQMLRKDVHHMSVGGAVNDSWLFGAVRFS